MGNSDSSEMNISTDSHHAQISQPARKKKVSPMNAMSGSNIARFLPPTAKTEMLQIIAFLEALGDELEDVVDLSAPNPNLRMTLLLMRGHLEGRVITATALIGASRVPYATANRRLKEMLGEGLIEQRPRTKTGKSFSMHPSEKLMDQWAKLSSRVGRLAANRFGGEQTLGETDDYYFGESYMEAKSIPPLQVLSEPLNVAGGLRVLVHGDPTFMVMDNLKRQFEQSIGAQIHQRAFSIDRLHEEAVRNADRKASRYDIIAVDLPWVGDFA